MSSPISKYPKLCKKPWQEKALEIIKELFGMKHPKTIIVCKNVITNLARVGKTEKAGRLAG